MYWKSFVYKELCNAERYVPKQPNKNVEKYKEDFIKYYEKSLFLHPATAKEFSHCETLECSEE